VRAEPEAPPAAANGCAAHASARGLLAGLAEADAFALDARLRRAVALEQRIEAEAAPLLRAIAERRLHRALGFETLDAWARERLGISPRKLRALLRLARASARAPELGRAFAAGALSWVQAHALVPVVLAAESAEERRAWVERAATLSARRLAEEVDAALLRRTGAHPTPGEGTEPAGALPAPAEPETDRFFFVGPADAVRLFRAVLCSVRRRLERAGGRGPDAGPVTEGRAAEWMFDHALEAWGGNDPRVPRDHAVFARDGWRCTVPGCTSYRNLHDHHVRFRSAGGSDALANRTTLCAWHHLRGVHQGRVRCAGAAPDGLRFELGLRPGRAPLLAYGPGEVLAM
jgi:hypothetical protein